MENQNVGKKRGGGIFLDPPPEFDPHPKFILGSSLEFLLNPVD